MKIKQLAQKNKEENVAILGCDISSEKIDAYSEVGNVCVEMQIVNMSEDIESELKTFSEFAESQGKAGVRVVAEPTGPYGHLLFRVAINLGMEVAWVSGEAVANTRIIENNSESKDDYVDSKAIHTLGVNDNTLKYRLFSEPYAALREWHGVYEDAEKGVVRARNEVHDNLKRLFPDYGFQLNWAFGNNGRQFIQLYGANPYRVVKTGYKRFYKKMKKHCRYLRTTTVDRLFKQCQASAKHAMPPNLQEILETRVRHIYEDFLRYNERKMEARSEMEELYEALRQFDTRLPTPQKGFANTFLLARIVAETGPLSDFKSHNELLKYAGIDLRVRQSGKYVGKTKISKRGRASLRKILSFAVLPLVRKKALYGPMFHKMRKRKTPGTKAMMTIARKFLRLIFGLYKSGEEFNSERVFECESKFNEAA